MPAWLAAAAPYAVPAIASLVGTGASAVSQGKMNKKNREFAREQADLQYGRSVDQWERENDYNKKAWWESNNYNLGLWHTQNEYNEGIWRKQNEYDSPVQQMARFKEAGLNPNLIYGQSNMGGSIATANLESGPQRTASGSAPQQANWRGEAPRFDLNAGILATSAFQESAARTDNLKEQNKVLINQAANLASQTAESITRNAKNKFDLDLATELRQVSVDAHKESLRRTTAEADLALGRNQREQAKTASDIREAGQRIAESQGRVITNKQQQELNQLDIELKRLGIQPGDNLFFRALGRWWNNIERDYGTYEQSQPDAQGNYKFYNPPKK